VRPTWGVTQVFTWGWNAFGQLGVGEVDDAHPIPLRNTWLHRLHVVHVSAGQFASAAVTADGDVYTWGQNDCGQLGRGDFTSGPSDTPQKLHLDAKVLQVRGVAAPWFSLL
jgi:alpha-tubulin suppressor-like RCC1 family protein